MCPNTFRKNNTPSLIRVQVHDGLRFKINTFPKWKPLGSGKAGRTGLLLPGVCSRSPLPVPHKHPRWAALPPTLGTDAAARSARARQSLQEKPRQDVGLSPWTSAPRLAAAMGQREGESTPRLPAPPHLCHQHVGRRVIVSEALSLTGPRPGIRI